MPIVTYAILARETYHLTEFNWTKDLPEGWSITKVNVINDIWGNCFAIFVNQEQKKIVLSVRGTDNPINVITDIKLALGKIQENGFIPDGQEKLDNLATSILKSDLVSIDGFCFTIIGYSLGAVMAELSATKLGIECVTFESPGSLNIMQHPKNKQYYPEENYKYITSYCSAPNAINTLNSHAGTMFRMYLPHNTKNFNTKHVVGCLLNTFFIDYIYQLSSNAMSYIGSFHHANTQEATSSVALRSSFPDIGIQISANPIVWCENTEWLAEQHYIDNIVNFLLNSGKITKMDSWPTSPLTSIHDATTGQQNNMLLMFNKLFSPLQKDQRGIRTIFNEDSMREAQIHHLIGYNEPPSVPDPNINTTTTARSRLNSLFKWS